MNKWETKLGKLFDKKPSAWNIKFDYSGRAGRVIACNPYPSSEDYKEEILDLLKEDSEFRELVKELVKEEME